MSGQPPTPTEVLAASLAADRYNPDDWLDDAARAIDALTAAGYVLIHLPEPDRECEENGIVWETGIPDALVTAYAEPPEVFIGSDSLRVDQARVLALALLGAAAAADGTGEH